ncbi:hypothetical protein SGFS_097720 [Streptomyces graminofaciens]|uniref:Aldehyde dehydrogenase domain-containing protein n=1 Tax=Streptomyces graminofaciens TaxID=68212 RepID=A0ABN5VYZ5_9ACTN|nr:aldehyde dehydrogenase family protein [Streptomyces graminofaciens]BBC38478.1 hypothetical protein SGFS_097720 [Streptomyces graminofaciens]
MTTAETSSLPLDQATVTIDGAAVKTTGTFSVINPATGDVFAQAPSVTPEQLDEAFASAQRAFTTWQRDEPARRAALTAAADAIDASAASLASLLTAEQGKPLNQSLEEIGIGTTWLRYFADLKLAPEVVQDDDQGYAVVNRVPLGVVAAIAPWNFPLNLAIWKIAPALLAGNTMVLKPSPFTPLSTLMMGTILSDVLPKGVLNVVSGPDPLGAAMTSHAIPRKISFTGSTPTGKKIAAAAASDLKRLTLELGGNDPAIVLADADITATAQGLYASSFYNAGQICLATKRVYAHESIHAELVEAMADIVKSVRVDAGNVPGAQLGPLNNRPQFDRVSELVSDALAHGARAVTGGKPLDRPGFFYEPTILDHVTDGTRIVDEEQFGPALPILSFRDEDDAVTRANASEFGLTASVWSGDLDRASDLAAQIDAGQISINSHGGGVQPNLPFGGHKLSGMGVENGPWGYYSFTETQVIHSPSRRR